MRVRPLTIKGLAVLCLLAVAAAPDTLAPVSGPDIDVAPGGEIGLVDWGLFSGHSVDTVPSEGTVEGAWHHVENLRPIEQTTEICAGAGTMFGIRYRLSDNAADDLWTLEIRTQHPMLHAPSGRSGDTGSYLTHLTRGSLGYTGWTVEYPYEHVPGDYMFSLVHNDQTVIRKTFHVTFACTPLLA